jgi:protocatechuate 3,4-dioxygenase beta subunit
VRRDGTIVPLRDLALVAAPFDRGELLLPAGGPIRGRVTSEGGGAVGGARVAIFDVDTELLAQFEESALGVTTTDEKGGFAFKGVAERHVRLEVTGVTGRANAVVPDAELFEAPLAIELAPAATIRGRLVDAAGAPIGDGRVGAHLNGPVEESAQRSAATDRDGAFTLDALAPGYYTLFAIADGCATQTIAQTHTDVAGLVIKLDRLASAHLVILNAPANLETPVVWRTAEPSGVTFRRTSSAEVAWCRGRELVVSGVPPGRHALELALPGAAPIVTSVATFAPNETTELGSLTLQPGAELSLRVTDVDGRPVRARVALASPQLTSNAAGLDPFALDHDERITDADGRCRWPDLPAGKRVVAVRSAGAGADALAEFEVPERGRVELPPLVIRPAGAVAGRVRARKGPPLAGMLVQVEGVGASRSATTDLDGRYEVRGLLPGNYVVTVIRRDEAPPRDLDSALAPRENPTAQVEVAAGATTPRDFEVDLE